MSWKIIKGNNSYRFVEEISNNSIDEFKLWRDENGGLHIEIIGDDTFVRNKILARMGVDDPVMRELEMVTKNMRCVCSSSNTWWIEMCIISICDFHYIKRQDRREITNEFGLFNLFHNESSSGSLAIHLAGRYGFGKALGYAMSETDRTGGESSCMYMLAQYYSENDDIQSALKAYRHVPENNWYFNEASEKIRSLELIVAGNFTNICEGSSKPSEQTLAEEAASIQVMNHTQRFRNALAFFRAKEQQQINAANNLNDTHLRLHGYTGPVV